MYLKEHDRYASWTPSAKDTRERAELVLGRDGTNAVYYREANSMAPVNIYGHLQVSAVPKKFSARCGRHQSGKVRGKAFRILISMAADRSTWPFIRTPTLAFHPLFTPSSLSRNKLFIHSSFAEWYHIKSNTHIFRDIHQIPNSI